MVRIGEFEGWLCRDWKEQRVVRESIDADSNEDRALGSPRSSVTEEAVTLESTRRSELFESLDVSFAKERNR